MSTLKELCNVPQLLLIKQGVFIARQKACESYQKRMKRLEAEDGERMFQTCKGSRNAKKARNTFSREEAGTIGQTLREKRFSNSYIHITFKTKNIY